MKISIPWLLLFGIAGCGDKASDTAEPGIPIQVQVLDPDGGAVSEAHVLMGGWPEASWVQTDELGLATVRVVDQGWNEQYLLCGKQGWMSGGSRLYFDDLPTHMEIELRPLPETDNLDYHFQAGGDGSSPDTSECGHCHWTLGDDWAGSAHAQAASSTRVWDLYTGAAHDTSEADCESLQGWLSEGLVPGSESKTAAYCSTGRGVLPWLNDCGGSDEPACEHPDERDDLEAFGSCADCHAPAIDGGVPGSLDLSRATGVGFEGVTCDLCHKIREVEPGIHPGLDGAISLIRPSEESTIVNQEFRPITFGPYADVIVPIMNGSYAPQFRQSEWCSACHEFSQPALHPEQSLSAERWPEGIPVFETWSEYTASDLEGLLSCQDCHMPALEEESSTYDITPLGLEPSVDQGWMRESGEVRHHGFSREGLGSPGLSMELTELDGELQVQVTVKNSAAGHAVPTGEPMKQLILRVMAVDENGQSLPAIGGQVVADIGGYRAMGRLGQDVELEGQVLHWSGFSFDEVSDRVLRFTRPLGEWEDYAGPGTEAFSAAELSAEDKGIEREDFLAELTLLGVEGEALQLGEEPPALQAGDRVYLVEEADHAGAPGWLFAKVLVDAAGARGVAHYRAVDVASDNRIAPGASSTSTHRFALIGGSITVEARLYRREQSASVADLYDWPDSDSLITTLSEVLEP